MKIFAIRLAAIRKLFQCGPGLPVRATLLALALLGAGHPPAARADGVASPDASRESGSALDTLYEQLAGARDAREAKRIEAAIARNWLRSGSDTADLLLTRAHTALGVDDAALAIELIDRAIVLRPDWTEAYALRGQVFAAIGDDERAVADINQVLLRDGRHFVALQTLAEILERTGIRKGALTLYERALAVNPHLDGARTALEKLRSAVEGRPL